MPKSSVIAAAATRARRVRPAARAGEGERAARREPDGGSEDPEAADVPAASENRLRLAGEVLDGLTDDVGCRDRQSHGRDRGGAGDGQRSELACGRHPLSFGHADGDS